MTQLEFETAEKLLTSSCNYSPRSRKSVGLKIWRT